MRAVEFLASPKKHKKIPIEMQTRMAVPITILMVGINVQMALEVIEVIEKHG